MSEFEVYSSILNTISTLCIIVGVVFGLIQIQKNNKQLVTNNGILETSREQIIREHDWNRRSRSFETLEFTSDPERMENLLLLNSKLKYFSRTEAIPLNDIQEAFQIETKLEPIVISRLNKFETIALGVHHKVFDEEVIKETLGPSMQKARKLFENYIKSRRQNDDPTAFEFIDRYCDKWNTIEVVGRPPTG